VQRFELDGAAITINPFPSGQVAFPRIVDADVRAVVTAAREIAREHEKSTVAWWIAPEHDAWAPVLEELGIVNEDTPGFEAIENAMAFVTPPIEKPVAGVEVRELDSFDDFRAASAVVVECFGFPELSEEEMRARYEEHVADLDVGTSFIAFVDGRLVGAAHAGF